MKEKKNVLIIGATSEIAEKCAELWAHNSNFILLGRNALRLNRTISNIHKINPSSIIESYVVDFNHPVEIYENISKIFCKLDIHLALIAHGELPSQLNCQTNLTENKRILEINGISPVLFAEAIISSMIKKNHGTLGIIGSVAGDRGRKSNYIYGSAKALVEIYAQGLQHRMAKHNISICIIKPGLTRTRMTAHIKNNFFSSSVDVVAKYITNGMHTQKKVIYAPSIWYFIMLIIKNLPYKIFNKLNI